MFFLEYGDGFFFETIQLLRFRYETVISNNYVLKPVEGC